MDCKIMDKNKLMSKKEWIAEWQKRLPLNYWLNLGEDEKSANGFYPNLIWLSISEGGEKKENYKIFFSNIQGKPHQLFLEEVPENIREILIKAWKQTIKDIPKFSATPSCLYEVCCYWENASSDRENGQIYRNVIGVFRKVDSAYSLAKKFPNSQIESPDGIQEIYDQKAKNIVSPDYILPFA